MGRAAIPATLAELPFVVAETFDSPHLVGASGADGIVFRSARAVLDEAGALSLGLAALGVAAGDRVAILSESRPDWLVADLAILMRGAVSVPVYPTVSAPQAEAILADSGVSVAVVSNEAQAGKVIAAAGRLSALDTIVWLDPPPIWPDAPLRQHAASALAAAQAAAWADPVRQATARATARGVAPDDLATIIYTSGSSGEPKGVMLTHANIVANLRDVPEVLALGEADTALSFLPLSHAFERTTAYVYLTHGVSVVFAESIDTLARDLLAIRPTVMSGVPRVFEKLLDRVIEAGRAEHGVKRRVFEVAIAVARERGRTVPSGATPRWWAQLARPLVDRLVFRKVRERLGGRLRFMVSGSAPLREDVGRLFYGLGLAIVEGYGLTETAPVLTVNPPEAIRFGTVGKPLPSVSLSIAADGEILARGPNIMRGYYRRPDLTAKVLVDGWFHTGDVGLIDPEGYLRITDRKKEIIVTSGGKKVAPQPIEAALRGQPMVAEAVVVGERQRFPAALLLPRWPALAAAVGQPVPGDAGARHALAGRPDARARLQAAIDAVNAPLAQFERLKAFAVIVDDFGIATGELTPTLKVKRRVILERYAAEIAALYAS